MEMFPFFFVENWESIFNVLTEDNLFSFHHSDRLIFERVLFRLRREPNEAMRVLAFWVWLEKHFKCNCVQTLLTYPMTYIEAVYEETLLVLRVVASDHFPQLTETHVIPILQNIVGAENINLRYFHEIRSTLLDYVRLHVEHVGRRAFRDIVQRQEQLQAIANQNYQQYLAKQFSHMNIRPQNPHGVVGDSSVPLLDPSHFPPLRGGLNFNGASSSSNPNSPSGSKSAPPQRQADRLREILLHTRMETLTQAEIVPSGERTIFLTFSKGYPISETELWDFFRRTYGDIIESLLMQEVCEEDQPLFAKLVVHEASMMRILLTRNGKTKFTINGKHVWARKFVKKNPNAASSSSSGQNNQ